MTAKPLIPSTRVVQTLREMKELLGLSAVECVVLTEKLSTFERDLLDEVKARIKALKRTGLKWLHGDDFYTALGWNAAIDKALAALTIPTSSDGGEG